MKVIICGAGQVGSSIARHLSQEGNDITVVDQSSELVRKIMSSYDVQGVVGFASRPDVLERAGIADADMIVAVTYADEVNMVACLVAHSLFNVPTKIARIREQSYLNPLWGDLFSRDNMPIDAVISPELEVARSIKRRLHTPGALDSISFIDGKVRIIGVRCEDDCPVINTPLRQLSGLFPNLSILIVCILRDGRLVIPDSEEQMLPGDEVYFAADANHVPRAMRTFGHEEVEARRIVIVGSGAIGLYLAKFIEEDYPDANLKMIEIDPERAANAARSLSDGIVLNGDALDPDVLEEANMASSEAVVAVTNDDENNILISLLAKRHGSKRAITLVNKASYRALISGLGVDVVIDPRAITVSSILQHVRRGRIRSVHSLGEGIGEVLELEAMETSPLVGVPLKEVNLPPGVMVGALLRGDKVITPNGDTVVKPSDRVVLFVAFHAIKKVEKMFSVRLEFF